MKTKLTLSIDKHVIEEAKIYAQNESTTLSALLEEHLRDLITNKKYQSLLAESQEVYQTTKPEVRKKLTALDELDKLLSSIPASDKNPESEKAENRQTKFKERK